MTTDVIPSSLGERQIIGACYRSQLSQLPWNDNLIDLNEASEIITQAVITKLAKSLSALQDNTSTDTHKPLQMYGVYSLLTIKLRNWIVKGFIDDIAVFETQGASTLETLSRLVASRSSIKHDQ